MAEKQQFDEFLGGSHTLPHELPIIKLISSRASEITAMTYSIDNPQQTKLIFQKLPVHMRRRVMSHNAKRLPRRLREAHLKQMAKSGLPPKSKRPSRKYRRRPRNLLLEYNRRQRGKVWLETHIWHAKRFHMVDKWGYRIASHANDKCFRANYRAVTKHCLMQDLSYYSCVEIHGSETFLKDTLKMHCNPTQLTFGAKIYTGGNREGTLMFFKKNGYPRCPIGNVHFLWRPSQSDARTIWIWIHPAFYNDVLNDIISSFEFKLLPVENTVPLPINSYENDRGCQMFLLKDTLNRFRLYGPLTLDVLTDALQLPNINLIDTSRQELHVNKSSASSTSEAEDKSLDRDIEMKDIDVTEPVVECSEEKSWYIRYYSNQENYEDLKTQNHSWQALETLQSPNQLPRNIVLGFTVLDPRFRIPKKRTKCEKQLNVPERMPMPPTKSNHSPIWDAEIRQEVTKSCVPNSTINNLRSECLVPGTSSDAHFSEDVMAKIPILLIQNPGNDRTGLNSGIDIIFPSGWAMPFWLAFVFRCTRIGALRESQSIAFERLDTRSPDINDPDTTANEHEALHNKLELTEKYFRYPPNRRVNFVKLGISSPFLCEWKILMKEWSGTEEFHVLRNRESLSVLQESILPRRHNMHSSISPIAGLIENKNCLVRVKVSILKRGCPKKYAVICMPTEEDLNKLRINKDWAGPIEKLNKDPNESSRNVLRKNHRLFLKRARRRRVRRRKAFANNVSEILSKMSNGTDQLQVKRLTKDSLESNREIVREQSRKMSKLYLPDCTKVRYSCDREIMGYVTLGDFSFSQAKGIGIGFIVLQSLIQMVDKKHNLVLVRNIQTRQYRFANLEILPA